MLFWFKFRLNFELINNGRLYYAAFEIKAKSEVRKCVAVVYNDLENIIQIKGVKV